MNGRRVLVAASPGIRAQGWLGKRLREFLPEGCYVTEFGGNRFLSSALEDIGVELQFFRPTMPLQRSDVRNSLNEVDHLLLFWDGRYLTDLLFHARLLNIPTKVLPFQVTEVVNKEKDGDFDVYVGRGTPWGNPFHVGRQEGQFERNEVIELYKSHFENNILGNESMRRGLLGLRGMRIACHCKPLACHGDVIAEYLNALDPDEISNS